MHVRDWDDEFFIRWKKLCAELNNCESLLLRSCFCIATMLNSRISLSIRNDSWILNDFLMLYCRICRKDYFVIKLFVAVVDSAMRRLFVCFRSSRIFLTFWLNISESAQMLSRLSHYSRKRKDWLVSSWFLLSVKLICQRFNCVFSTWLLLSLRNSLNRDRLIASSRVLEFESGTRLEKCRVELEFFWKSVESSWEVEFEHSSRIEKLDSTIRFENSIRFDKILGRCK